MPRTPGSLSLVGTPIGNLGDVTLRAIETLRAADRVAAEDTRRARALLSHLGITGKPLFSLDANAGDRKIAALLDHVAAGEDVVFVTDAGMPSVSDPGTALVRAATERGVPVQVIPGPSAVSTAVAQSGLVESSFLFLGFLPRSGGKRQDALAEIAGTRHPVVLFEAPGRTEKTLKDLARLMPERSAAVCRELTKLHEETVRGSLSKLAETPTEWRGEIVVVVGPSESSDSDAPDDDALDARIAEELSSGASTKDVTATLLLWSGRPKRELYARVERLRRR